MIRVQTETKTEMLCIKTAIEEHCQNCKGGFECMECNYNNITYEIIDLKYSKPVEQWDFNK